MLLKRSQIYLIYAAETLKYATLKPKKRFLELWSDHIVPDELKVAKVTPMNKKNSRLEVGNYKPISVLPSVSKILEKCVYNQLQKYLVYNKILFKYKSGFRPHYSTDTCLVYLTNLIKAEMSKRQLCRHVTARCPKGIYTLSIPKFS